MVLTMFTIISVVLTVVGIPLYFLGIRREQRKIMWAGLLAIILGFPYILKEVLLQSYELEKLVETAISLVVTLILLAILKSIASKGASAKPVS
jgi:hypothetical protein